jgi:hypothetical protein
LAPNIAAALMTEGAIATQDGEKSTGNKNVLSVVMGPIRAVDSITPLELFLKPGGL